MKKLIIIVLLALGVSFTACTNNVSYLKEKAPKHLETLGYSNIKYQGYETGFFGGNVWYVVTDTSNNSNYNYELATVKWNDEIHIYNLKCLNALSK